MIAFTKILIANRGEIACRVTRTAKALGYRTVAVFSDADAGALHVRQADEAVRIGPPPAQESYLNIEALLAAAKLAGADAVHPGYGFLSENAAFAEACTKAGLVFIGPPAAAIDAMGNKARAKALMEAAGVPVVPGYRGADQSDETLIAEGRRIGFPLMVKAAAGGGGRGMRLVAAAEDLAAGAGAQPFRGGKRLRLRRTDPRAGDRRRPPRRDPDLCRPARQRHPSRRTRLLDPAPAPESHRGDPLPGGLDRTARANGRSRGRGGTRHRLRRRRHRRVPARPVAKILLSRNEHPASGRASGDRGGDRSGFGCLAVAHRRRRKVAAGRSTRFAFAGHAIEARLYAEDPHQNFLPQSGVLVDWRPASGEGVRIDHGLAPGQNVSPFYDPMLAKVIAHGATREEARRRLIAALEDTVALGLTTNRSFLIDVLRHPAFAAGEATTAFIDRHFPAGSDAMRRAAPDARLLGLAAVLMFEARARATEVSSASARWFSTGAAAWPLRLTLDDTPHVANIATAGIDRYAVTLNDRTIDIAVVERQNGNVRFTAMGLQQTARFALQR